MHMKKIMILLMVLCLCGCSYSASHTESVSTSINGETVTTTTETKVEDGQVSTSTITTTENDPTGLRNKWPELFTNGAEGVSEDGNNVYFIYNSGDNGSDSSLAAVMIADGATGELLVYDMGDIEEEKDHLVIHDVDGDSSLPFVIDESAEGGILMRFQNGDSVFLEYVSLEQIIDDMISIWEVQGEEFVAQKDGENYDH